MQAGAPSRAPVDIAEGRSLVMKPWASWSIGVGSIGSGIAAGVAIPRSKLPASKSGNFGGTEFFSNARVTRTWRPHVHFLVTALNYRSSTVCQVNATSGAAVI
jgi:hypothetical protein